jgi:hypothetical protein
VSKWLEFLSLSLSPLFLLLPFLRCKARLSLPQLTPLCVFQFIGLCDTQILSHIFLCRVGTIFLLQWLSKWQLLTSLPIIASTTISINEADSILHIRTCNYNSILHTLWDKETWLGSINTLPWSPARTVFHHFANDTWKFSHYESKDELRNHTPYRWELSRWQKMW